MSGQTIINFEGSRSQEDYENSPTIMPSSGLLTPPMLYNSDVRRDSIASAHTSLSFGSCSTDYLIPVTPTPAQSPPANPRLMVVIPYELGQEAHNQTLEGLPLEPKTLVTSSEGLYDPWLLDHTDGSLVPPNASHGSQDSGRYLGTQIPTHPGLETSMSPAHSPWGSWSNVADAATSQSVGSHLSVFDTPRGVIHPFWAEQMNFDQSAHMMPLHPSTNITDLAGEYVHVAPTTSIGIADDEYVVVDTQYFSDSETFVDVGRPLVQLPQEVRYKQESSPSPVKQETNNDYRALRMEPLIYESRTGGKSVKREQGGQVNATRRRSRVKSSRRTKGTGKERDGGRPMLVRGEIWDVKEDGEFLYDEKNKKWGRTKNYPTREVHSCRKCPKSYTREEHRTRHERSTHGYFHADPSKILIPEFPCIICYDKDQPKCFNRHDNLVTHYLTHIAREGFKTGRNPKMPLSQVQAYFVNDPKTMEKIETMHIASLRKDADKKRQHAGH